MDLKTEIEAAIGTARSEVARLELDLPDGLPAVRAVPGQLGRAFASLLAGTARAVPAGHAQERTIRIAARARGDRVVVEVTDDGAGVLPADVARIVESLGGTIEVEGRPGGGSVLRLGLRVEQEKAPPAPGPAPAAVRRGKVLVVDDEPLVARSLARLLSAHEVTVLTSASDALARAAAGERWDVVLCDLMMPEMSGMDLEERLAVEAPDLIPRIVYLTGGAFTERSRAFLASGRPHLEKPIEPAVLRAEVAERVAALPGK